ncbi:hypothetical protein JD844_033843 [Phrynosoma platyrhinos]|uniref:Ubiquitin-like domain-containing protein n=1 Tax=Phrynosoma platyrhinos TaxID=52577 RepID=A0ABQ7T6P7_PHRPL|nr:hypothetical protein JD844_033843 [Phrynosoma platyrhinos]
MIVKTPWQVEEFLVHKDMFVREFKEHVARHFSSSPDQVELVYGGRILKDHKTLSQHAIHLDDNATVYAVIRSQRAVPTRQVSVAPTSAASDQKPVRSSTFARDRLRELTASLGLNTANFDEFQSQLMSKPDVMLQLLENPFIQSKLSSPGLMKELVTNNPQVQQVMQRAPEISHFFTSPEGMRLVVELAKNPAAVREIIRSPPQALGCPGSVPSGDNNSVLQDTLTEVQGLVERHLPKRPGATPRSQRSPCDCDEQPGRIRECRSSPKPWPPKTGVPKVASSGSDHSKGESNGAIRGEAGQLASAAVKSLLHQIIKHLVQNITGSPCRNTAGQPLTKSSSFSAGTALEELGGKTEPMKEDCATEGGHLFISQGSNISRANSEVREYMEVIDGLGAQLLNLTQRVEHMSKSLVSYTELDFELLKLEVQEMERLVAELKVSMGDSNLVVQQLYLETERAYQKQPTIFQNKKRVLLGDTGKEKLPRYYKNIGLGFKTPKEAIEGTYIDKKCPFTGNVSIRGRILSAVGHDFPVDDPKAADHLPTSIPEVPKLQVMFISRWSAEPHGEWGSD